MAATRTAPAMEPMMMLVPLGPAEGGRVRLAGTGARITGRAEPTSAGARLTLIFLRLPRGRRGGQGVVNAAVFAGPIWLADALPFVAADLEGVGVGPGPVSWAQCPLGRLPCHPRPLGTHPVVGADAALPAARAGAEVEGGGWQAAVVQAQHVGPAGCAILHVAQV